MKPQIVIDMNLSIEWVAAFAVRGWTAVHWSMVGDIRASDHEIMAWAKEHGAIIFTHDLDFGTILATTQARGPSVIQVRTQNILPEHLADLVGGALDRYEDEIQRGAIIVINEQTRRVRLLPLHRRDH